MFNVVGRPSVGECGHTSVADISRMEGDAKVLSQHMADSWHMDRERKFQNSISELTAFSDKHDCWQDGTLHCIERIQHQDLN